jgi:lysine-specific demethylase 3
MDVADAINIMLYASTRPDGQPGCAVWDLFRAEDADTIRSFLSKKYEGKVVFTDPIHSQVFYLDSNLRGELAEKHGVVSWRVYQYPVRPVSWISWVESC